MYTGFYVVLLLSKLSNLVCEDYLCSYKCVISSKKTSVNVLPVYHFVQQIQPRSKSGWHPRPLSPSACYWTDIIILSGLKLFFIICHRAAFQLAFQMLERRKVDRSVGENCHALIIFVTDGKELDGDVRCNEGSFAFLNISLLFQRMGMLWWLVF